MKLASDTAELIHAEVMMRVFDPVEDDVPDPGDYFDACIALITDRVGRQVQAIPEAERHDWFLDRAMAMHGWCARIKAPTPLTERVDAWLSRLIKTLPAPSQTPQRDPPRDSGPWRAASRRR
jgi:hypothetical protein